jgi:hypothetical protein
MISKNKFTSGIWTTAAVVFCCFSAIQLNAQSGSKDRQLWLQYMDKMAKPVLSNLAEDKLKEKMPVELASNTDNAANRTAVSYLEAFGRTFSGIAPWLNLEGGSPEEIKLRDQYRQWVLKAMAHAVDPKSKDYMKWTGGQPLVDASFLALGLVRCSWIWQNLDTVVKAQVITAFKSTRAIIPSYSNWVLFTGMIEAFFYKYGYDYDPVRIEFAIREFANHWYVGDGLFSDGMNFHMDYYNSIVIHPYLATIMEVMNSKSKTYEWYTSKLDKINKRYAEIQERNINTDGSYPVIGRSIAYRGGVFHQLADIALRKKLPESLKPAQVRSALMAVIKKTMDAPGTYNNQGWLALGLYGSQPAIADYYINTGSLYLCSNIFLPLGLPETDEFWSTPPEPWTAVKVWSGKNVPADHAVDLQ